MATAPGGVLVRDSKDAEGPHLEFTEQAWRAFTEDIKDGEPHAGVAASRIADVRSIPLAAAFPGADLSRVVPPAAPVPVAAFSSAL